MTTTAVDTTDLKNKLSTREQPQGDTIYDLLEKQKPELARVLGQQSDRFARTVLTEVRRTPELLACSPMSLLGSLMYAAQLKVEPGPLGQAWLVPFWNNKTKRKEVQFILGYRGMIDLALRDGKVKSIVAREVCQRDDFEIDLGAETLRHRPFLGSGPRGDAYAYYGVAKLANGEVQHHVMRRDEIDRIRERAASSDKGPWATDYDAMARKTVIRQMSKYLPLSVDVATAIENDEVVQTWHPDDAERPLEAARVEPEVIDVPSGGDDDTPSPEDESSVSEPPDAEGEVSAGAGSTSPGAPSSPIADDADPTEVAVERVRELRGLAGGVATARKRALSTLLKKAGIPDDLSRLSPDDADLILKWFEQTGKGDG